MTAVRDAEQSVIEYQLDPEKLTASASDTGLLATLVLGVSEILSGRYLQQAARAPGALDDFKVGPITVTASRQVSYLAMAQQLGAHGAARLAPYGRSAGLSILGAARSGSAAAQLLPIADLLPSAPALDGASGALAAGLFGTLQGSSLGTDASEPPDEFTIGGH